jgi:hypothetical protein
VLIAGLVRMALLEIAIQPLWEGLARRQWTDDQLRAFEARLGELDLVAEAALTLRGERAFNLAFFGGFPGGGGGAPGGPEAAMRMLPGAMRYRNQLAVAQMYDEVLLPVLDVTNGVVDVGRETEVQRMVRLRYTGRHPYRVFANLLLPALDKFSLAVARNQASITLARVACALERHRLATGTYPATLDGLAPRWLDRVPPDPAGGRPLVYRPVDDGRFTLYSAGVDGRDDGGQVKLGKQGRVLVAEPGTDWVWRYPAPEVAAGP